MLFRRFENLIDVFKPSPDVAPPAGMLRFYAHYLKQVWPLMTAVLVVGFFAALIEVALSVALFTSTMLHARAAAPSRQRMD